MTSAAQSLREQKNELAEALDQHMIALNDSKQALEQENIARRATVTTSSALQSQVTDCKVENMSLKKLNQKRM